MFNFFKGGPTQEALPLTQELQPLVPIWLRPRLKKLQQSIGQHAKNGNKEKFQTELLNGLREINGDEEKGIVSQKLLLLTEAFDAILNSSLEGINSVQYMDLILDQAVKLYEQIAQPCFLPLMENIISQQIYYCIEEYFLSGIGEKFCESLPNILGHMLWDKKSDIEFQKFLFLKKAFNKVLSDYFNDINRLDPAKETILHQAIKLYSQSYQRCFLLFIQFIIENPGTDLNLLDENGNTLLRTVIINKATSELGLLLINDRRFFVTEAERSNILLLLTSPYHDHHLLEALFLKGFNIHSLKERRVKENSSAASLVEKLMDAETLNLLLRFGYFCGAESSLLLEIFLPSLKALKNSLSHIFLIGSYYWDKDLFCLITPTTSFCHLTTIVTYNDLIRLQAILRKVFRGEHMEEVSDKKRFSYYQHLLSHLAVAWSDLAENLNSTQFHLLKSLYFCLRDLKLADLNGFTKESEINRLIKALPAYIFQIYYHKLYKALVRFFPFYPISQRECLKPTITFLSLCLPRGLNELLNFKLLFEASEPFPENKQTKLKAFTINAHSIEKLPTGVQNDLIGIMQDNNQFAIDVILNLTKQLKEFIIRLAMRYLEQIASVFLIATVINSIMTVFAEKLPILAYFELFLTIMMTIIGSIAVNTVQLSSDNNIDFTHYSRYLGRVKWFGKFIPLRNFKEEELNAVNSLLAVLEVMRYEVFRPFPEIHLEIGIIKSEITKPRISVAQLIEVLDKLVTLWEGWRKNLEDLNVTITELNKFPQAEQLVFGTKIQFTTQFQGISFFPTEKNIKRLSTFTLKIQEDNRKESNNIPGTSTGLHELIHKNKNVTHIEESVAGIEEIEEYEEIPDDESNERRPLLK